MFETCPVESIWLIISYLCHLIQIRIWGKEMVIQPAEAPGCCSLWKLQAFPLVQQQQQCEWKRAFPDISTTAENCLNRNVKIKEQLKHQSTCLGWEQGASELSTLHDIKFANRRMLKNPRRRAGAEFWSFWGGKINILRAPSATFHAAPPCQSSSNF